MNSTRMTSRVRTVRAVSTVEVTVLVLAIVGMMWAALASGGVEMSPSGSQVIRVSPGDSPWSLARQHPVEGLTTADVARMIIDMNGLHGSYLPAGSEVRVPAPAQPLEFALAR